MNASRMGGRLSGHHCKLLRCGASRPREAVRRQQLQPISLHLPRHPSAPLLNRTPRIPSNCGVPLNNLPAVVAELAVTGRDGTLRFCTSAHSATDRYTGIGIGGHQAGLTELRPTHCAAQTRPEAPPQQALKCHHDFEVARSLAPSLVAPL